MNIIAITGVVDLLIALDELGVCDCWRDGQTIRCGFRRAGQEEAPAFKALCREAVRSGLKDRLLPMLRPVPRGC